MRMRFRAIAAGGLLVSLTGCLALQGQVPVAVPLKAPEPPAHVVMPPALDPIVEEPPPTATLPTSPVTTTSAKPPTQTSRPPDRTTPPPVTPPEPAPVLQPTANTNELLGKIQKQMDEATRDLGKVARTSLSPAAREQYDVAQSFLRQAQDFVKVKFYSLADQLSDKAARLAAQLVK
jgi:hypothetical protein